MIHSVLVWGYRRIPVVFLGKEGERQKLLSGGKAWVTNLSFGLVRGAGKRTGCSSDTPLC